MSHLFVSEISAGTISHIVEPAIRTAILAGIIGAGLALFRPKTASVRLALWMAVLFAALAMPFLAYFLPALTVPLPVGSATQSGNILAAAQMPAITSTVQFERRISRPAATSTPLRQPEKMKITLASVGREPVLSKSEGVALPPKAGEPGEGVVTEIFISAYFLAAAILACRFAFGFVLNRRLRRAAVRISEPVARACLDRECRAAGLRRVPLLAESAAVTVPVTASLIHPVILFPAAWRVWEEAKLAAVLAHEVSHVKRRDAGIFGLSAAHLCIFWFSPLAWWLDHKLRDLAEEASDEAALRAGADTTDYAEILLSFFTALSAAGKRVSWRAISMAQGSRAERRLSRILSISPNLTSRVRKPTWIISLASAVPVVCLMAAVRPTIIQAQAVPAAPVAPQPPLPFPAPPQHRAPAQQAGLPAPPRPVAPPPPGSGAQAVHSPRGLVQGAALAPSATAQPPLPNSPTAPGIRPAPPATPAAPNPRFRETVFPRAAAHKSPPSPPAGPQPPVKLEPGSAMVAAFPALPEPAPIPAPALAPQNASANSNASELRNEKNTWYSGRDARQDYGIISGKSVFISGSAGERDEVNALRSKIKGDFIWFFRNGKSYVIEDPATVKQAAEYLLPEQQLGREQAALGRKQEYLGSLQAQAAMAERMRSVQVHVPSDLATQLEKVEADIKQLGTNTSRQELGRLQGELGRIQGEIGSLQSEAGDKDGAFGEQMGELGRQQGRLGREQGRLGREQARLARQANREMDRLIDSAFGRGLAKPAP